MSKDHNSKFWILWIGWVLNLMNQPESVDHIALTFKAKDYKYINKFKMSYLGKV